jgi:hypothetical protein
MQTKKHIQILLQAIFISIHTSNKDEAVLATLLTGLKYNDIYQRV